MIVLADLTDADKGRPVTFTYHHGEKERGVLSSWNDSFVFVRFNRGVTGEACNPAMCSFD